MGVSGGFAAMGVMSVSNAYAGGINAKTQADYTSRMYGINKQMADEQGREAKDRGDIESGQEALKGDMQVAQQKVASAATGANVNSGSALELQTDTKWQSGQNQIMLKNNAWRQAWGYKVEAGNYANQAEMAEITGKNQANSSYLTGGMNAISYGTQSYAAYQKYN